ncbi:hypothetical protein V2J23_16685 [Geobacillus thermoleovorans]|uniref:hypothetical protein n=1 Tax=Geobacillus thermoleovorans TaxID=33941 RepID=UPI00345BC7FC
MSILKIGYQLSKKILTSPKRDLIKSTIQEINLVDDVETPVGEVINKVAFGKSIRNNSAKKAKLQIYGYLLANHQRKKIEQEFNCVVPELSKEQIDLLTKLHRDMLLINKACISLLPGNLTHHEVLDPYALYESIISLPENYSPFLFEEEDIQSIKTAFKTHKGFEIIRKIPINLLNELNKIDSKNLLEVIEEFKVRFHRAGVNRYPKDVEEAIAEAKKNKTLIPTKYIFSLLCIRYSLRNLNQLIYQAYFQDKLPILNEDNIIDIKSSSHFAGKGYLVTAQQLDGFWDIGPGDLIHLIDPLNGEKSPILCQVEGITLKVSKDFGMTYDFKLRALNEDLNPFYGIFDDLER